MNQSIRMKLGKSGRRKVHHHQSAAQAESSGDESPSERSVRKRRNKAAADPSLCVDRNPSTQETAKMHRSVDKTKTKKSRSQSPNTNASHKTQTQAEAQGEAQGEAQETQTAGMVRSPAMHEGFRLEDWIVDRLDDPVTAIDPPDGKSVRLG